MFFIQILLGILIIFFELKRKKERQVDFITAVNLIYFVCYVIAPICGYYMQSDIRKYSVMMEVRKGVQYNTDNYLYASLVILIGYIIFIFSYSFFSPKKKNKILSYVFLKDLSIQFYIRIAILLFALGLLSLFFASLSAGGLLKWIIANPRLYFENDRAKIESSSWIVDKGVRLMLLASFIFWGILKYYKKKQILSLRKYLPILRILTVISFLLSTVIAVHVGGRLFFFQYFIIFVIANLYVENKKITWQLATFITFLGGLVLLYGRTFFRFFIHSGYAQITDSGKNTFLDTVFDVVNNYTFPFFSTTYNLSLPSSENRQLFIDAFTWPLQFLPPTYKPDDLPYSSQLNTFRLMNLRDIAIVPTDIYSYGSMNLGLTGIVIILILFGILIKTLNSYSGKLANPVSIILFINLMFIISFRIMYCDPVHLFKGSFETFIVLGLIGYTARIKKI